ncbi:MAG: alpha/beta hydrolase [Clostridia bacterium]|nr:alpha/beta hydrolase [Clostridia bacterium]
MEKKYLGIGGEVLAYLDEGAGEPILLLHGNMSSSLHFEPLIQRLQSRWRCVAPDLRGFGDSTYRQRFDSLDELAEDVSLFMDRLGIRSAFVVGWSTGGGIGLKLAAMHPEKVKRLFCIEGAGHRGYPIFEKDAALQSTGRPYESKLQMSGDPLQVAPMLRIFGSKDTAAMTAIWDATIYPAKKPSPEQSARWIAETLKQRNLLDVDWALATLNMSEDPGAYGPGDGSIGKVRCPVALTSGQLDMVVPEAMVLDNLRALGDRGTLLRYENCGHSPLADCPDRLSADIEQFFSA